MTKRKKSMMEGTGLGRRCRFRVKGGRLRGIALVIVLVSSGCQLLINPFRDELMDRPAVSTVSVQAAARANVPRSVHRRPYQPIRAQTPSSGVTHAPLYFEDPFEKVAGAADPFAWSLRDYVYFLYGPGRFLANIAAVPVSTLATPPWMVMASDGDYANSWLTGADAVRAEGPAASQTPGEADAQAIARDAVKR